MLFNSQIFLFVFLPLLVPVYFLLGLSKLYGRAAQNLVLLVASLLFYAWGEPTFVFILMGSIVANWIFGLLVDRYRGRDVIVRLILVSMLVVNLGVLFAYKYVAFAVVNVNAVFGTGWAIPKVLLPIGISFFTFQAISYVVDVHRGITKVQRNLISLALFISFFPQLTAGPIVRYQTIAEQLLNRRESLDKFCEGFCRFLVGLAKKVIIANQLGVISGVMFNLESNPAPGGVNAWLGVISFTLQIYYDFSAYSDMALGLSRMFGFELLENFNYPYQSRSISEFWRRWHISLGSFFRDYVYFPLGGSRVKTRGRLILNLSIVWFLTGLWHGASYNFILWGLWFLVFIVIEKLTGFEKRGNGMASKILKHVYAMTIVLFGWVLFYTTSLHDCADYVRNMFTGFDVPVIPEIRAGWVYIVLGLLFAVPAIKNGIARYENTALIRVLYPIAMLALFLVTVSYLISEVYRPFIYFNF